MDQRWPRRRRRAAACGKVRRASAERTLRRVQDRSAAAVIDPGAEGDRCGTCGAQRGGVERERRGKRAGTHCVGRVAECCAENECVAVNAASGLGPAAGRALAPRRKLV